MKNNQKAWKVIDILKTTTDYFTSKEIENPRLNAEQLLASVLKLTRVQLYVQFERILSGDEINHYREFIRRRADSEPLQYILGETEFMGLPFKVSPVALIPRPETELLVEHVIETVKSSKLANPSIIDIGTGSGCIAISLARFLPGCSITATDVTQDAIDLAQQNSFTNKTSNITFLKHDIIKEINLPVKTVDVVVSNPPYVSKEEMEDLPQEIKNHEPQIALTDFDSGLLFYQRILSLIDKDLKCKFVFMEINANLKKEILSIAKKLGFHRVEMILDLNNLPRVLKIEI